MKFWTVTIVLAVAALAVAAQRLAVGQGGFTDKDDGVATINFDLREGRPGYGSLLFAADGGHHHEYPDTIITAESFERVRFSGRTISAEGYGMYLNEPAWIQIRAWDGAGTPQPDRFSIRAVCEDGHVFEMNFSLNVGDIAIRNR